MLKFNCKKILISLIIFISSVVGVLYPFIVYYFLVIHKIPLRNFSLFIIAFTFIVFITATSRKSGAKKAMSFLYGSFVLLGVGVLCLITDSIIILKFYPVFMNIILLVSFGSTLFVSPNMIFRFASLHDKSVKGSLGERRIEAYCRKVTLIWCVFFIFNASAAGLTILSGSDVIWSVYNGGISYILVGLLFAAEFLVRKITQRTIPKAVSVSAFKNNSRISSHIVCYEGTYGESNFKTWRDFLAGTAKLREFIKKIDSSKWLLYSDDVWHFLLAFTALLQCKKQIMLSANISSSYIDEIRDNAPILTDNLGLFAEIKKSSQDDIFLISKIIDNDQINVSNNVLKEKTPEINADDTFIVMYTSGSTGQPKKVIQRLTEFENDNKFILSKWGDEFLKRKLFSTVNQHHIYGLLFSVLLPFTAGVPFRRTRIDFPEEIEKFTDTQYMIITVPAFLKRAVELKNTINLHLTSPWIYTSGGVLEPRIAEKTNNVFGFRPIEVYGSTETSGVAWRQSSNGLEWTPFDNVKLRIDDEGYLNIISPYIKDKEGFKASDMVDLLDDGRFLLKGRIDSVVKIEEKRISLTEIESRIMASGLVSEVIVIPLHDRRQYLASVIVFNEKGKEKFSGLEKKDINNFWRNYSLQYFDNIVIPKKWRYLEKIPSDSQGKKSMENIKNLFVNQMIETDNAASEPQGFSGVTGEKIIEKNENSVTLEISVPASSPYFDGHFPNFPVLPAVAQVDLVVRSASEHFGINICISKINRIKFINIIRPDNPLILFIEAGNKNITFKISSPGGGTLYSSGVMAIK